MAVFRIEKNKNYTVMSNYHLKDKSLTLKSKGLLSMILSLPEEWNYTTRGLAAICNQNYQKLGKDLMSMDELAVMDGSKCIMQLRGERPFFSNKYDITKHKNYKLLSDTNKKNTFDIEDHLSTNLKLKADDVYDVIEIDLSDNTVQQEKG